MMVNWDLMIAVLKENFQHMKHNFSEHHILQYLFRVFMDFMDFTVSLFISPILSNISLN